MESKMTSKNPEFQKNFELEVSKELEKYELSWDNDMREWHTWALKALETSSPVSLGIKQESFSKMIETTNHGIPVNIVAYLANNLERKTAKLLETDLNGYVHALDLNSRVAKRWNEFVRPIRETVAKRLQIQANKPKILTAVPE